MQGVVNLTAFGGAHRQGQEDFHMLQAPTMSVQDLTTTALELVANGVILEAELPAEILADKLISEADPVFVAEFRRALLIDFNFRQIRAERAKKAKELRRQSLLPGFEHLPLRIVGKRKKRVALAKATREDIREYYWVLGRKHADRKDRDPRRAQAKALMEKMAKPAKETPGITVSEVLGL